MPCAISGRGSRECSGARPRQLAAMQTRPAEAQTLPAASFRDPIGSIFERDGRLMRRINRVYADDYEHLMVSGLYRELTDDRLLVPHLEIVDRSDEAGEAYK